MKLFDFLWLVWMHVLFWYGLLVFYLYYHNDLPLVWLLFTSLSMWSITLCFMDFDPFYNMLRMVTMFVWVRFIMWLNE